MKRWSLLFAASMACLTMWCPAARGAETGEEQKLIEVLKSSATPAEKDAACARLKFIGTRQCVPALAALLTDEQLSHSARYALEAMAVEEAGAALLDSLGKTKGLLRVGIINSLAAREEARAVPALAQSLGDPNPATSVACARCLGQIGGGDAAKALRACARNSSGELHEAAVDGLLRCANRQLTAGQRSEALAIFEQLDVSNEAEPVRVAAFTGRVRASGNAGLNLVLHAISGPAGSSQLAALQLVRDLKIPNATAELVKLLPSLQPPVQVSLVGGLGQRGDVVALPALTALAEKAQPEVQLSIIRALDEMGDASVVGLLSGFAATGTAEEKTAARQALADLHRGEVTSALLEKLSTADPQVQAEIARALGERGDKSAMPKLVELAQRGPVDARKSALQALSVLVDDSHLVSLVELVVQAPDQTTRTQAAEALNAAYRHLEAQNGHADSSALVQGFENGSTEARIALLPVCSGLVDSKIRAMLRIALHDQNPKLHSAAVTAVCDTVDAEMLPDVIGLAQLTKDDAVRTRAIDGGVRLVTQEDAVKLTPKARLATLKSLLGCAGRPEQKRKVLAGLGELPDLESLSIVDGLLEDQAVRNEAASAAAKIAGALPTDPQASEATLKKALAVASEPGTRQAVESALRQIQSNSDYLTSWEVAGPYREANKDYAALFDIAFAPENKSAQDIKWQSLPPGSDPKRPWVMDLLKALGGQQCVAYARTSIHSDKEQSATLELGSDDGIKAWLNDKQVYALNTARPLQPGSDKVNVTLRPGWNPLLLKITQNNQGWEFCVRVRNADGSHLEGLRCDSSPKAETASHSQN